MSVGNYGAVKNQIEQMVATLFNATRTNQAMALSPHLCERVLARPDFANTLNAKLVLPALNLLTSTTVNLAYTGASSLVGIWVDNNQASTDAFVEVYASITTVTLGTSVQASVPAKANTQGFFLFAQPIAVATGIGWVASTTHAGGTGSTASTITAAFLLTA